MRSYIVVPINVFLGHFIQHFYALKCKSIIKATFKSIIESLHRCIVIGATSFTHTLGNTMFPAEYNELPGGELYALVTVIPNS